jgi:pSer/pThr/pTyr-binding forkhead associated (FHA) protein
VSNRAWNPTDAPEAPRAVLVVCGADPEAEYPLCEEETLLGRGAACNVTLDDGRASREHAFVSWDAAVSNYVVEDLHSTNGTKVNGKRIRSAELAHGDVIEIGRTQLRVEIPDRAT